LGASVLLLGLDPVTVKVLRESSQEQDITFRIVREPGEALDTIRRHPVDLVLIDLDTTGLETGTETLLRIKTVHPGIIRAVVVKQPGPGLLISLINRVGIRHVFTETDGPEEITKFLRLVLGLDVEIAAPPGTHVLVVEINLETAGELERALGGWGLTVESVRSGTEALRLMRSVDFKAIIANRNIPYIMGWTLVEFLKQNEKYRHIPLLMITDQPIAEAEAEIKEKGIDQFIRLPLVESDLRRKLARALRKTPGLRNKPA